MQAYTETYIKCENSETTINEWAVCHKVTNIISQYIIAPLMILYVGHSWNVTYAFIDKKLKRWHDE
jgi:hypothetical protein